MFGWFAKKKPVEVEKPLPVVLRYPLEHDFEPGDRVKVKQTAGFHKGARGSVVKVALGEYLLMGDPGCPPYDLVWVERDGAGSPVWYLPHELDHDVIEGNLDRTRELSLARPSRPSI